MNSDRAGFYRKNLSGEYEYRFFVPAPLPPNPPIRYDEPLVRRLANANKQLNLPDGLVARIPSINSFYCDKADC